MAGKCLVCSPKRCRPYWVYVVEDPTRGLSKVGISYSPTKRLCTYRKKGAVPDVILRHKIAAPCEFLALGIEAAAHKRIAKSHKKVRGDWYDASVEASIAALSPTRRKDG